MSGEETGNERYRWAGPALFTVVLVAVAAFFWWFL